MIVNRALVFLALLFITISGHAQWAVYDEEVKKQLIRVNKIDKLNDFKSLTKTYDHFDSERAESGDIKMGAGSSEAVLKGLDTKFEELPELTDEDKLKYVGTLEDCGQKETNPKHWEACVGLRNLRLQTIKQSHAMLKNLAERRKQIVKVIIAARNLDEGDNLGSLGQLQRAQFEIQGQQALMQADALQIQVLMDGYKQREATYMLQQTEARKGMLSRPDPTKTAKAPKFFPIIKAAPSNN
jgi:hypothetical protein